MKVILYMAMSVDGYVARLNDETPWSDSSWEKYIETVNKASCLIVGKRTYEIMNNDGNFALFTNLKSLIVLSHSEVANDAIQLKTAKDAQSALALAAQAGCEMCVLGGGPTASDTFMQQELADEIHIDIEPILLGSGIPFLKSPLSEKLKLMNSEELGEGVVHIEYEVIK